MRKIKYLFTLLLTTLTLAACALPGLSATSDETIRVSGSTTSETQTLAYVIKELIEEETDYTVDIVNNLGSSALIHQAMLRSDVQISGVRYTGTDLSVALGRDPITDPDEAMLVMKTEFAKQFDQKYYDSYGFENTYAVLVTEEFAEEHDLETVSDLEDIADTIHFGVDGSWLDRKGDGYEGFTKKYGFTFNHLYPMQLGLVYDALEQGSMDAVLGYTTDGRIASYGLKILEDDRQFFPPYDAAPVARYDLLEKYPEIDELLERLAGTITNETMQELNFEVDDRLEEPSTVAKKFLEDNNYFRDQTEKAGDGDDE